MGTAEPNLIPPEVLAELKEAARMAQWKACEPQAMQSGLRTDRQHSLLTAFADIASRAGVQRFSYVMAKSGRWQSGRK
jgi:hypothetical protein